MSSCPSSTDGLDRATATRRVLWVEDSESDQMLLRLAADGTELEGRVDVASTFETGLALARLDGPEFPLVIVDMRLGARDGCELVAALRSVPRTSDAAFVVLTGSTDELDIRRAEAAGAMHMGKPISFDGWCELVATLGAMVQGNSTG